MQTYLAMIEKIIIENGLVGFVVLAAAGIFIISLLLCLLVKAGYRNKLDSELKNERANHEQDRVQLSENLNAAHEKIQQLEEELSALNSRVEQTERDKQAALAVAERTSKLEAEIQQRNQYLLELLNTFEKELGLEADAASEDTLWQRHEAAITALTHRLHSEEQRCAELGQTVQSGQTMLAEKEAALDALNQTINEQAAHIAETEQDFATRLNHADEALLKNQAKYQSYKKYFGSLVSGRMQVFNDLNSAAQKIHQLEVLVKAKESEVERLKTQEHADELVVADAIQDTLPVHQPEDQPVITAPEKAKSANPLFARFVNAVKSDFGLSKQVAISDEAEIVSLDDEKPVETQPGGEYLKQLAEKDAVIDALKTELEARQHHISRLEGTLEAKTPVTADVTENVADQESVAETSGQLFDISKVVEKAASFPLGIKEQWRGLFKKQSLEANENEQPSPIELIEETVDVPVDNAEPQKTGMMPEQLKGLFQKMKSFTR